MYIAEISGELSIHNDFTLPLTKERILKIREIFDNLIVNLMDRGMSYIDTWITEGDEGTMELVERLFGFVDTNTIKQIRIGEEEFEMRVFRFYFPTKELMKVLEGVRE